MKKLHLFGGLAATAILFSGNANASIITAAPGSLTACEATGAASTCGLEYVFNADGSVDTYVDPTVPSTDNIEDVLTGVINNSGHDLSTLHLSGVGGGGLGVFDFDGDGQSTVPGNTYNGHYFDASSVVLGITTFSGIGTVSATNDTGNIDFGTGLPTGGHGWWVLEDSINSTAPPVVGGVPEPGSLALLSIGLAAFARSRRKTA